MKLFVALGLIGAVSAAPSSVAFRSYPGYEGDLSPNGIALVSEGEDATLKLDVLLSDLETNRLSGVHIHTGTTCESADEVGGKKWMGEGENPWDVIFAESDAHGFSSSSLTVDAGYGLEEAIGHAVVLHSASGTRVACGVLGTTMQAKADAECECEECATEVPTLAPATYTFSECVLQCRGELGTIGAYRQCIKRSGPLPCRSEPVESPDTPTEPPTESPDTPTESPDTPTESPDTPTESPDTPTESPDTATEEPDPDDSWEDFNAPGPDTDIDGWETWDTPEDSWDTPHETSGSGAGSGDAKLM